MRNHIADEDRIPNMVERLDERVKDLELLKLRLLALVTGFATAGSTAGSYFLKKIGVA